MVAFDAKIPAGPLADKWDTYKANAKLVNPNNKRKFKVIVVGTGLAGASAAATLATPRTLDRGAGRYQRREELSGRWRLGEPPVHGHDQGWRLPLP
jgi:hypothetical protein